SSEAAPEPNASSPITPHERGRSQVSIPSTLGGANEPPPRLVRSSPPGVGPSGPCGPCVAAHSTSGDGPASFQKEEGVTKRASTVVTCGGEVRTSARRSRVSSSHLGSVPPRDGKSRNQRTS